MNAYKAKSITLYYGNVERKLLHPFYTYIYKIKF